MINTAEFLMALSKQAYAYEAMQRRGRQLGILS
jgi:hypothetical protein